MVSAENGMVERWQRWVPVLEASRPLQLVSITREVSGTDVILGGGFTGMGYVLLCFGRMMAAHRLAPRRTAVAESALAASARGGLFIVLESPYLMGFELETYGMTERDFYTHVAFVDESLVLDMATGFLPAVQFIDENALAVHRCPQDPELGG